MKYHKKRKETPLDLDEIDEFYEKHYGTGNGDFFNEGSGSESEEFQAMNLPKLSKLKPFIRSKSDTAVSDTSEEEKEEDDEEDEENESEDYYDRGHEDRRFDAPSDTKRRKLEGKEKMRNLSEEAQIDTEPVHLKWGSNRKNYYESDLDESEVEKSDEDSAYSEAVHIQEENLGFVDPKSYNIDMVTTNFKQPASTSEEAGTLDILLQKLVEPPSDPDAVFEGFIETLEILKRHAELVEKRIEVVYQNYQHLLTKNGKEFCRRYIETLEIAMLYVAYYLKTKRYKGQDSRKIEAMCVEAIKNSLKCLDMYKSLYKSFKPQLKLSSLRNTDLKQPKESYNTDSENEAFESSDHTIEVEESSDHIEGDMSDEENSKKELSKEDLVNYILQQERKINMKGNKVLKKIRKIDPEENLPVDETTFAIPKPKGIEKSVKQLELTSSKIEKLTNERFKDIRKPATKSYLADSVEAESLRHGDIHITARKRVAAPASTEVVDSHFGGGYDSKIEENSSSELKERFVKKTVKVQKPISQYTVKTVEGKRAATKKILKNEGLKRYRSKKTGHARIHNRFKFERRLKINKVAQREASAHGDYQGEHTGIRPHISKSVPLGIGLAIAKECILRGAAVITIIARDRGKLQKALGELVNLLKDKSQKVQAISCDVTKPESIRAVILALNNETSSEQNESNKIDWVSAPTADSQQQSLDVLVTSAGLCISDHLENLTDEDIYKQLNTNVVGTIVPSREVFAYWKKKNSSENKAIVLLGSVASQINIFGYSVYGATKYAVRGFWEGLSMECIPYNINAICVFPPDTDTAGLVRENKRKPQVTKMIEDTTGLYTADVVANKTLNAIENGVVLSKTMVTFGFFGVCIAAITNGFGPRNQNLLRNYWNLLDSNIIEFLLHLILMPVVKIASLGLSLKFQYTVKNKARCTR